jgi:hypothetical protein
MFDMIPLQDMRASLAAINMLGEPRWRDAAAGDAAASIQIALGMKPQDFLRGRHDLAMTDRQMTTSWVAACVPSNVGP